MQALERLHPGRPLAPGKVERRECEYVRHGTRTCIVSRAVASGQGRAPSCGPTRTEADFLAHVQGVVATDLAATPWHFVVDNLNTHQSASLVRIVADHAGVTADLGVTGQDAVLASQPCRAAFLRDPSHPIVLHHPPQHRSWLNQVELWLSILVRTLRKRGSFPSVADLQTQLLAFSAYYNRTMPQPFQWTYQGQALLA